MSAVTPRRPAAPLPTPRGAKAPEAGARFLAPEACGLSGGEALRVQCHRDRLLAALQGQDRTALEQAKQEVLEALCLPPGSPALRRALRELSWRMAGLRLSRRSMQ